MSKKKKKNKILTFPNMTEEEPSVSEQEQDVEIEQNPLSVKDLNYLYKINNKVQQDLDGFMILKRVHKKKRKDILPSLTKGILYNRYDRRAIPRVDEGVRKPEQNMTNEELQDFYHKFHIGEYVHLETIERGKGQSPLTRIKFEFEAMLDGYSGKKKSGENETLKRLSYAEMGKKSFINKLNNTMRYINYFIEYFDDDDELMTAYFSMMYQIMNVNIDLEPEYFIENLYANFATESLMAKIVRMVEYNTDETLVKTTDRTYDESIQLTIDHLKAIMAVSCIHKFIIPIVSHYYYTKSAMLKARGISDKDLYFDCFSIFVGVFDEYYDVQLYNKLYLTASTRTRKTTNQESPMWNRRARFGITPASYSNQLMKDFLIDISQKAVFSKSVIAFIHTCFDRSIRNELIQSDPWEFVEMKMEASDGVNENISRWDRWQMDKTFHSQKDRIRSHVSIKDSLQYLGEQFGINFKKIDSKNPKDIKQTEKLRKELEFYRENIPQPMDDSQMYIMRLYYMSIFNNDIDFKNMEPGDIIKLIMIMKRDFESRNFIYLRFFISSKVMPAADHRYNKRKLENLFTNHPLFEDWIKQYPDPKILNLDRFFSDIKNAVACPITVYDYSYSDYNGMIMTPLDINVVDEIMRLVTTI